jgi:hypothetical protein
MLAERVARVANQTDTLADELHYQAKHLLALFDGAQAEGKLIRIVNPKCITDVFTDRWPLTLVEQRMFINDLRDLVAKVDRLVTGCELEEMQAIMVALFGEKPTVEIFKSYAESIGSTIRDGRSFHVPGSGRLVAPAVVSGAAVTARPTAPHTFHHGKTQG